MSKIVRVDNGDYKIGVRNNGFITLDTGPSQGTTVLTGNALLYGDSLGTTQTTFNLLPFYASTVNFALEGNIISIGSVAGTTTVNHNVDIKLDLNVQGGNITTSATLFNLLNTTATTVNAFGEATTVNIGAATGTTSIKNDLDVNGALNIDGSSITTSSTTFNLLNTTATTVNAFGEATTVNIGAATGNTIVNHDLVITGNLIVNGTTTTVNSTEMSVDDINIILGATATPTDAGADSGGITLKGTTDKTLGWSLANLAWTSSENFDLAIGNTYKINAIDVLSSSGVLNAPTTVTAFQSATSIAIGATTGTTDIKNNLNVTAGNITSTAATVNLLNTNATLIVGFASADHVTVGKTGGIFEILSTVQFGGDINVGGDVSIGGGDMTATTTSFNLLNTTVTDIFFGGAATNIQVGAASGTTNVNNNLVVDLDLGVNGGDITTSATSFNLLNTTATTVNAFGAATAIAIGATTGTTNVKNNLDVDADLNVDGGDITTSATSFNLLNTTATTLNIGGAATAIAIGATTGTTNVKNNLDVDGTLNVDGNSITTTAGTVSIANSNTTTLNIGGAATAIAIGATTGTTNVKNNLDVDGTLNVDGGTISSTASVLNLVNTNVTTLNLAGAATTIGIGAASGNTTVNNNLIVAGDLTVNGTTTTVNSSTVSVDDINIVLGSTASPTDATSNGGGLTLKGTTDKTLSWIDSTDSWTSSENIDLATSKTYKINAIDVLSSSSVLNSPTSVTAFQSATTLSLGATTGTSNVRNNLTVTGNASFNSIDFIKLPVGTTAERPGSPAAGQARFNSTTSEFEGYNGAAWGPFGGVSFESVALTSTTPYVLDSFALSSYRTAKYTIQMQNIVSTQLIEILVVHNESQVTYDTIKNTVLGGDCATISVQISGSNIQVIVTPIFDATEIQFTKTRIISTSPVVGTLPYIPTTDLQTGSYAIDLLAYNSSTIDLNA